MNSDFNFKQMSPAADMHNKIQITCISPFIRDILCVHFQEGHTGTIATLLSLGADLHAKDKKGRTGRENTTFTVLP